MLWTYDEDGTVTYRAAVEYLLGGGFLYERDGVYRTADSETVSAELVARLMDVGHLARDEWQIHLTEKGRRELGVPRG